MRLSFQVRLYNYKFDCHIIVSAIDFWFGFMLLMNTAYQLELQTTSTPWLVAPGTGASPEAKKAQSLQDVLSKRVVQLEAKLQQQSMENDAMNEETMPEMWGVKKCLGNVISEDLLMYTWVVVS